MLHCLSLVHLDRVCIRPRRNHTIGLLSFFEAGRDVLDTSGPVPLVLGSKVSKTRLETHKPCPSKVTRGLLPGNRLHVPDMSKDIPSRPSFPS